jgi:hypothetical protein
MEENYCSHQLAAVDSSANLLLMSVQGLLQPNSAGKVSVALKVYVVSALSFRKIKMPLKQMYRLANYRKGKYAGFSGARIVHFVYVLTALLVNTYRMQ